MRQCGADACCIEAQFQLAGEPVVAPDVAQGAGTLACNGHAMAHVSRVVAVTGEAAPEVVELVDHLEWLALQDDRLHQRSVFTAELEISLIHLEISLIRSFRDISN